MGPTSGGFTVSSESKEIKVTDKRMFTAEGELREEYRFLDEKATAEPGAPEEPAAARPEPPPPPPPPAAAPEPPRRPPFPEPEPQGGARLELPVDPAPGFSGASFLALLEMLAEPALIYLGDIELPEGTAENLEMARLHIDLLEILRQKTAGNLNVQESAALEDLLYQLRVRYVQKRG
jgi:Domain of unknown function (DUF1844)